MSKYTDLIKNYKYYSYNEKGKLKKGLNAESEEGKQYNVFNFDTREIETIGHKDYGEAPPSYKLKTYTPDYKTVQSIQQIANERLDQDPSYKAYRAVMNPSDFIFQKGEFDKKEQDQYESSGTKTSKEETKISLPKNKFSDKTSEELIEELNSLKSISSSEINDSFDPLYLKTETENQEEILSSIDEIEKELENREEFYKNSDASNLEDSSLDDSYYLFSYLKNKANNQKTLSFYKDEQEKTSIDKLLQSNSYDTFLGMQNKLGSVYQSAQKSDEESKNIQTIESEKQRRENESKLEEYYKLSSNPDFEKNSELKNADNLYDPSIFFVQQTDTANPLDAYINGLISANEYYYQTGLTPSVNDEFIGYQYLTEEERKIYNYLNNTRGNESAKDFLISLQDTLAQRNAKASFENVKGNKPAEVVSGFFTGGQQFLNSIDSLFSGDNTGKYYSSDYLNAYIKEDLADDAFTSTLYDLSVNLGNNAVPQILSFAAGPAGSIASSAAYYGSFGASVFGSAKNQALLEGASEQDAYLNATLTTATELGLDKLIGASGNVTGISEEKLLKKASNIRGVLPRVASTLAIRGASEFTEEALQEALSPVLARMTYDDSASTSLQDVLYAGLIGGLSGVTMSAAVNIPTDVITLTNIAQRATESDTNADALVSFAKELSQETATHAEKVEQKKTGKDGTKNSISVGSLAYDVNLAVAERFDSCATISEANEVKTNLDLLATNDYLSGIVNDAYASTVSRIMTKGEGSINKKNKYTFSKSGNSQETEQTQQNVEDAENNSSEVPKKETQENIVELENTPSIAPKTIDSASGSNYTTKEEKADTTQNKESQTYSEEYVAPEYYSQGVVTESGEDSSVRRIKKEDGEVIAELSNGESEKVSSLTFNDDKEQALLEAASRYDDDKTANAFMRYYKKEMPVSTYINGWRMMYNYGRLGVSKEEALSRASFAVQKTNKTAMAVAYNMGVRDEKNSGTTAKLVTSKSKRTQFKEGTVTDDTGEYVSETGKEDLPLSDFLKQYAKKTGVDITISEEIEGGENARLIVGSMKIELSSQSNIFKSLGHETGEFALAYNKQGYDDVLKDIVDWWINQKDIPSFEDAVQSYIDSYSDENNTISYNQAVNELVNDAISGLVMSEKGINQFVEWVYSQKIPAKEKKSVFEKLKEVIKKVVSQIKSYISDFVSSDASSPVQLMSEKDADNLRNKLFSVLDTAIENANKGLSYVSFNSEQNKQSKNVDIFGKVTRDQAKIERLKRETREYKHQLSMGSKKLISKNDISYIVSDIKKLIPGLKVSSTKLFQIIDNFYNSIVNNSNITAENIEEQSLKISKELISYSNADSPVYDDFSLEFIKDLKSVPIKLSSTSLSEIKHKYGTLEQFRRKTKNRIVIKSDAIMMLDERIHELSSKYKSILSDDTRFEDPTYIAEVLEKIDNSAIDLGNSNKQELTNQISYLLSNDWLYTATDEFALVPKTLKEAIKKVRQEEREKAKDIKLASRIHEAIAVRKEKRKSENLQNKIREKNLEIKELRSSFSEEIKSTKERYKQREEQKKNTILRNKIIGLANKFASYISNPTKSQHAPKELYKEMVSLCGIVIKGGRDTATVPFKELKEKMNNVLSIYLEMKDKEYDAYLSEVYSMMLNVFGNLDTESDVFYMNNENLNDLYSAMKALDHAISNANKIFVDGQKKEAASYAYPMMEEVNKAVWNKGKSKDISNTMKFFLYQTDPYTFFKFLGGESKNNSWVKFYYDVLNQGQRDTDRILETGRQILDKVYGDKVASNEKEKRKHLKNLKESRNPSVTYDIGLVDEKGNPIRVTKGVALGIWMDLQNEDNTKNIVFAGKIVPYLSDYYKNKKNAWGAKSIISSPLVNNEELSDLYYEIKKVSRKARSSKYSEAEKQGFKDELLSLQESYTSIVNEGYAKANAIKEKIESIMNDYDRNVVKVAKEFFEFSSAEINKTSNERFGFDMATVKNYYPIEVYRNFVRVNDENISQTLANSLGLISPGFTHSRNKNAKSITLANDIYDVMNRHLDQVSKYCGVMYSFEKMRKVFNISTRGQRTNVRDTLRKRYGVYPQEYINKLEMDALAPMNMYIGDINFFGKALSNYTKAVLVINIGTFLKQPASYITAAATIPYKHLAKAMNPVVKNDSDETIFKYAGGTYAKRKRGYSTAEAGALSEQATIEGKIKSVAPVLVGIIQKGDMIATKRIWLAAKYYAQEKYNLKWNSEEHYKKTADIYMDTIERTQSNYSAIHKTGFSRTTNTLTKATIGMFQTQNQKNMSMMTDAVLEYVAAKERKNKAKKEGKSASSETVALKESRKNLAYVFSSQVLQAGMVSAVSLLIALLYRHLYRYEDDDGGITPETAVEGVLKETAETMISNMAFVGPVFTSLFYGFFNAYNGDIEAEGVSALNDLIVSFKKVSDAGGSLISAFQNGKEEEKGEATTKLLSSLQSLAKTTGNYTGIPVGSIMNYFNAAQKWAQDIADGGPLFSNLERTEAEFGDRYYNAYLSGNKESVSLVIDEYSAQHPDLTREESEAKLNKSLKSLLKQTDDVIDAANLRIEGEYSKYEEKVNSIIKETGIPEDIIKSAVESVYESSVVSESGESSISTEQEKISLYSIDDIVSVLDEGDIDTANDKIIVDIFNTKVANYISDGKDEEDAEKSARSTIKSSITREYKKRWLKEDIVGKGEIEDKLKLIMVNGDYLYSSDDFDSWE